MKSTTDYSIFRSVNGNRGLSSSHVNKLTAAIFKKNLLYLFPIIVNEKMELIDGQHRLASAKRLEVPIFYEILKQSGIDDVQKINTSSHGWSQSDYLISWIKRGNKEYMTLSNFMVQYKIPLGCARRLLGWTTKQSDNIETFKNGQFKVNPEGKPEQVVELIKALLMTNSGRILYTHVCLIALMNIVQNKKYNHERMLDRINVKQPRFYSSEKVIGYIRQIEDVYNYDYKRNIVKFD